MAPAQRHARRAGLVAASAFAFVPMVGASPAHACDFPIRTDAENFARTDVVFRGTLTTRTETGGDPAGAVLTFAADRLYMGDVLPTQPVRTNADSAACGLALDGDGPFLVFARFVEGAGVQVLRAGQGDGTRTLDAAEALPFGPGTAVGGPAVIGAPSAGATAAGVASADLERGAWLIGLQVVLAAAGAVALALFVRARRA